MTVRSDLKITLIVALSRDGFLNRIGQTHADEWTSKEDQQHYRNLLKQFPLQIMGINTYEAYEDRFSASSRYERIVLTHHPKRSDNPRVSFIDATPTEVVAAVTAKGHSTAALLGGGQVFTAFLQADLVDEAYITIEPLDFQTGIPFLVDGSDMNDYTSLTLVEEKELNAGGTRLLHYQRKG